MSALRKVISYTAAVAALIGGYALWRSLGPVEQRNRHLLKNLPEWNPVRMEESRTRTAQTVQLLKHAAHTDDNIARTHGTQK